VRVIPVTTAVEMQAALEREATDAKVIVMAAAVADHRPAGAAPRKLEHKGEAWSLPLVPNPDILAGFAARRPAGQLIVGFAAETHDAVARGRAKRERKGCDLLVVNDVTAEGAGFEADTNVVTLIGRDGTADPWPRMSKRQVAERLLDRLEAERKSP
jgi:phosphopantothenoylcysteine decarboxylase/phosphopantothenate--cysteine ligase